MLRYAQLAADLAKYQDPEEADKILKIQKDLEETKTIMHQAIGDLLERGEKLDDLVQKSGDLGSASKAFYQVSVPLYPKQGVGREVEERMDWVAEPGWRQGRVEIQNSIQHNY